MSYNKKEFNKELNSRFLNIQKDLKLKSYVAPDSPFYINLEQQLFQQVIMYDSLCSSYKSQFKKPYNKSLLFFITEKQKIICLYIPFKPSKK